MNLLVPTHLRQGCVWHAGQLQVVEKAMHGANSFTAAVKLKGEHADHGKSPETASQEVA
ncbi:hypothetical protein [Pseudomonas sp. NFR16]|uniref:hypothetical protein n=1 Tax=Pseudomonas sp. NFR16 TaxID=1566248 RepID=UPI0015A520EF|nr:hypothetical protein [Pseudomonas sp. NFR16]